MTRIETIKKKVKSQIGLNTHDTFRNHWKIFFNEDDRIHGTITSSGFKIWKYDRIAKGLMHPVITADLIETDKLHVNLRSKMNVAGLMVAIFFLTLWGVGGFLLIKGEDTFVTFLKYRIPIWFLYFSVAFLMISYPYSIARKEIITVAERIIKEETQEKC